MPISGEANRQGCHSAINPNDPDKSDGSAVRNLSVVTDPFSDPMYGEVPIREEETEVEYPNRAISI
ncbi:MAG: hypothetical protein GY792_20790 [Gammaproteobacteria bacterium]|nr:hypothetical protein [Gammaproteobacteria bacterium]